MKLLYHTRRSAGLAAILAGLCWLGWVAGYIATQGATDRPYPDSPLLADWLGRALMIGWNVLLLPAAIVLWRRWYPERPLLAHCATIAGIGSLLLWAAGGATRSITLPYEVSYIALSSIWWVGIGWLLRQDRPRLGNFTLLLGVLAAFDAAVTTYGDSLPFIVMPFAGLKLPLSTVWDFWIGLALLREPGRTAPRLAPQASD